MCGGRGEHPQDCESNAVGTHLWGVTHLARWGILSIHTNSNCSTILCHISTAGPQIYVFGAFVSYAGGHSDTRYCFYRPVTMEVLEETGLLYIYDLVGEIRTVVQNNLGTA